MYWVILPFYATPNFIFGKFYVPFKKYPGSSLIVGKSFGQLVYSGTETVVWDENRLWRRFYRFLLDGLKSVSYKDRF